MTLFVAKRKQSTDIVNAQFHWLKEAFYVADNTDDSSLVVDLTAVEMISSDELNELIRLQSKIRNAGRKLVLENVQEHLWQVFTVTRLDRLIEMRPSTGV